VKKGKKATIIDVASAANVSRQTVSRVLLDSSLVADKTRKKVQDVIDKMDYRPDPVARSLVNKRTYIISILISGFTGYTRDRILAGAEREARKHNYNLFICEADEGQVGEPVLSPLLNTQRYEGLFVLYGGSTVDNFRIFSDIPNDIPVVTLGYKPDHKQLVRIPTENRKGAYIATRHLLDLGHRRIGVIAGMKGMFDVTERLEGYKKAIEEEGLQYDPSLIRYTDWTPEGAYNATEVLLEDENFTALFVQNDLMAVGCLGSLYKKGLLVPRDISLVGFDNIDIGKFTIPPLTTVNNMIYETGRKAIQVIIDSINNKKPSKNLFRLPTELVVRSSTSVPSKVIM
jgi:DNA-binding LacI/PurR family transcriptional regulator